MPKIILVALAIAFTAATSAAVMAASGSCGRGKVWDTDAKKCVPKPRGSGSGSHGF